MIDCNGEDAAVTGFTTEACDGPFPQRGLQSGDGSIADAQGAPIGGKSPKDRAPR